MARSSASVSPALESHLGYWLRRVSNHVSGRFARELRGRDVSVAEWVVLRLVHDETRQTPGNLATVTGLSRGAISKVLDKLDSKGLLERETNPADSRVQWLSLSRKGAHLVPHLAAIADDNDERFFACLSAREQKELRRLLAKIVAVHELSDVPVD